MKCEQCNTLQPANWQQGDLCIACSGAVQTEVRCIWCIKYVSSSAKYCNHCGCDVLDATYFASARILKNLGVNQLDLPYRTLALPESKQQQYIQLYQQHYSVVAYGKQLLEQLTPYFLTSIEKLKAKYEFSMLHFIPFEERQLKNYKRIMKQNNTMESIINDVNAEYIEMFSAIQVAREKTYPLPFDNNYYTHRFSEVGYYWNLHSEESALWFAHPNSFSPYLNWENIAYHQKPHEEKYDAYTHILVPLLEDEKLRPYAGVALYHVFRQLQDNSHNSYCLTQDITFNALTHTDVDIVLSAAILLKNKEKLQQIAFLQQPIARCAFAWLVKIYPAIATKLIKEHTFSMYWFYGLKDIDNELKTVSSANPPIIFHYACMLLHTEWQSDKLFGKPLNEIPMSLEEEVMEFIEAYS